MPHVYSTYEAKAKFSEIIRKVRAGKRVVVAHRGQIVAEIRPIASPARSLEDALDRLQDDGVLGAPAKPAGKLGPLARKPGALARFLESRE
jgi:prevent-host-death family protein